MDFLKSAVASAIAKGSSFPYSFGDRLDNDESIWTLHNGTKREDGSACSIFTFDIAANKSRLILAKNAARKLRTLRHPGVIKILETIETDTNIYVVTEKLVPLGWHVKRRSLSEETAKWGLYTVACTLKFINEDALSVHGSVRVSSIYTSASSEWKLGGFDVLSSMKDDDAIIYNYGSLVPDYGRYAAPEITKGGWDTIKRNPLPAVDAYGFGLLIYEVFNGSFRGGDQLGQTKNVPSSMHQSYKRLLNANPKLRLSTGHFLEQGKKSGGFFETPLIRLTQDIESLGLKSETEREELLSELDDVSDDFPEDFFKMKVLPELLKSVEFGGGGPKVFGVIMKIGSKLSDDEYNATLTPVIVRLYSSPDRAMRVCLLDNLPLMIDRLPQKVVNDRIFSQMVTGFTDIAPVVREQTVKAVLTIITKLSDRTINGELLKYLAKTSNDEQPGIRTNTTICLGKIAKHLGANTRPKVLVAAFTRSLRDPFVHARNAALIALAATMDFFPEDDCASRILPALCPSLLDKEKLVRDQANKTLDLYLQRVRKFGTTLADTALPPPNAMDSTSSGSTRMGTQKDTSWAGWAISSFTNKLTAAKGEMQPTSTTNGTSSAKPSDTRSTSMPPAPRRSSPPAQIVARDIQPSKAVLTRTPTERFFNEAQDEADGVYDAWGAMDDEEDSFFDAPSSRRRTPSPVAHVAFDDGGEPDFAGWLAAQSKSKSKKLLPKGLSKPSASQDSTSRPMVGSRTTTTGSVGSGIGAAKLASTTMKPKVVAPKKVDTKPREVEIEDDGWGDAWD